MSHSVLLVARCMYPAISHIYTKLQSWSALSYVDTTISNLPMKIFCVLLSVSISQILTECGDRFAQYEGYVICIYFLGKLSNVVGLDRWPCCNGL